MFKKHKIEQYDDECISDLAVKVIFFGFAALFLYGLCKSVPKSKSKRCKDAIEHPNEIRFFN